MVFITRAWRPFSGEISGPPESPWHESFPESAAQIMLELIVPLYALLHLALLITVTSASCRVLGLGPLDLSLPHPVTVARTSVYVELRSVGRHAGLTLLVKVTGFARRRME